MLYYLLLQNYVTYCKTNSAVAILENKDFHNVTYEIDFKSAIFYFYFSQPFPRVYDYKTLLSAWCKVNCTGEV